MATTAATSSAQANPLRPQPRRRAKKLLAAILAAGVVAAVTPVASAADTVRITDPVDGATIPTSYSVKISATDDQRVMHVLARVDSAIYKDAVCSGLGSTAAVCSFTTPSTSSLGAHTLWAKARDSAGNVSKTSITFIVGTYGGGGVDKSCMRPVTSSAHPEIPATTHARTLRPTL